MKNDSTLAYLRRLNPVPEAASVDGAELFERITSLPRDERPAPRRSATRRRVALVAVGACRHGAPRHHGVRGLRTGSGTSSSRP